MFVDVFLLINRKGFIMRTSMKVIICLVVVVLLSLLGGCLAGNNIIKEQKAEQEVPSVVGSYQYDKWNGDETVVLHINADGTCRYPSGGIGTWTQEGDKIIMDFGEKKNLSGGTTINTGVSGIKTCTLIGDVDGVMLNGFFFEKIC